MYGAYIKTKYEMLLLNIEGDSNDRNSQCDIDTFRFFDVMSVYFDRLIVKIIVRIPQATLDASKLNSSDIWLSAAVHKLQSLLW